MGIIVIGEREARRIDCRATIGISFRYRSAYDVYCELVYRARTDSDTVLTDVRAQA